MDKACKSEKKAPDYGALLEGLLDGIRNDDALTRNVKYVAEDLVLRLKALLVRNNGT